VNWLRRRVREPLEAQLRQGLSPQGLAWSVAMGLALGVFPVLGATTILCAATGQLFRLNQPALQLVNYLAYPLQLALILPFIRLGERLFGGPALGLSLPELLASLRTAPMAFVAEQWTRTWHACVVWALLALPGAFLLALVLRPVLASVSRRMAKEPE
jgi:uncharacterized protein (DUF2062 family)